MDAKSLVSHLCPPLYHVSCKPLRIYEMTIQPARHEWHACCPLQAEKPWIQPVEGNTHGTHVEQVVSSFQKILGGSQLTWYKRYWVLPFKFYRNVNYYEGKPNFIKTGITFKLTAINVETDAGQTEKRSPRNISLLSFRGNRIQLWYIIFRVLPFLFHEA